MVCSTDLGQTVLTKICRGLQTADLTPMHNTPHISWSIRWRFLFLHDLFTYILMHHQYYDYLERGKKKQKMYIFFVAQPETIFLSTGCFITMSVMFCFIMSNAGIFPFVKYPNRNANKATKMMFRRVNP